MNVREMQKFIKYLKTFKNSTALISAFIKKKIPVEYYKYFSYSYNDPNSIITDICGVKITEHIGLKELIENLEMMVKIETIKHL